MDVDEVPGTQEHEEELDEDADERPGPAMLDPDGEDGRQRRGSQGSDDCRDLRGRCRCRASPVVVQEIEDEVERKLCDLLAFLEIEKSVPESTVDKIMDALNSMATYGQRADPCGNPLRAVLERVNFDTGKQRKGLYQGLFGPPSGKVVWIPGVRSERPNMYFKAVSSHLRELFNSPEVVECLSARMERLFVPWYQSFPQVIHDFRSSERFRAISEDLGGEPFVGLRVFGDGFSPNQLGAHRVDDGELYGIYAQLVTYPANLTRALNSWFTVALASSKGVHEARQIWSWIVCDLEVLVRDGIFVPELMKTVPVVVTSYAGDLKDQNDLCAMAGPSSSRYPHATSLVTSEDRFRCQTADDINPLTRRRNRADHAQDIETYARTRCLIQSRGARNVSILDSVCDFIEHDGLISCDIAHSFYLGCSKTDIGLSLATFLALGYTTEEEIATSMESFKLALTGEERSNFVTGLFSKVSGVKLPVKGSISQTRLLVKYLPYIFAHLQAFTVEGEAVQAAWQLMVEIHKMFGYIEAFALTGNQIDDFQEQIEAYINVRIKVRDHFKELTNEEVHLVPKHIDLMWTAQNFRATGSLVMSSTTIMESRNALHKTTMQKSKNRVNPIKTLSVKTELWEKYHFGSLLRDKEVIPKNFGVPRKSAHLSEEQTQRILAACGDDFAEELVVHGKSMRSGQVLEGYKNEQCKETRLVKMLGVDVRTPDEYKFIVEEFESVYLRDLNCYGAKNFSGNVKCMRLEALCNPGAFVLLPSKTEEFEKFFVKNMISPII